MLHPEYRVLRIPVNGSPAFNHKMPYSAAVASYFENHLNNRVDRKKILKKIHAFLPDLSITDYESNLPWISRMMGLTCLSLDHQHIALLKYPSLPLNRRTGLAMLRIAIWMQFREITRHMIISFFHTSSQLGSHTKVFPPILRKDVLDRTPSPGNHVLAYHGYSTTTQFHKFLQTIPSPVLCYGMNVDRVEANVTYKKNSSDHFIDDLASCRYVISTAGHTLLSEALFYNKPVMAFPIRNAFEQFLNGYFLEKKGFGLVNDAFRPSDHTLETFEKNIDDYRKEIKTTSFCGNEAVNTALDQFFKTKEYVI